MTHTENSLQVLFHASCNVECGYFSGRGRGFQTVAVSEELIGTEDLKRLEDLATYYEVSADRRAAGDLPVKRTFFRLPSGKYALGETVDWGAGPSGRPGNYLAKHLIVDAPDLLAAGGPGAITMEVWQDVGGVDPDQPRAIPGVRIKGLPVPVEVSELSQLTPPFLGSLLAHVADPGERTALLVGDEARCYRIIQQLISVLPPADRLSVPYSTHFYRACDFLRPQFRLVSVRSWSEAPSGRQAYLVFDLERSQDPSLSLGAYVRWLVDAILGGRTEEIQLLNHVIESAGHGSLQSTTQLPDNATFYAALWERVGAASIPVLPRDAALLVELLGTVAISRPLADALLTTGSPAELCGPTASPDAVKALMTALKGAATPRAWNQWTNQWPNEPRLTPFRTPAWAFWKR